MIENYKYLAGLLDSDGSIYCDYRTSTDNTMSPIIKVSISQKHPSIIFYIKDFVKCGSIYYNRNTKVFTFYTIEDDSVNLLKNLLPHLVLKKSQAEFCLNITNEGARPCSKEEIKNTREANSKHRYIISDDITFCDEWFAGFFDGNGYIGAYKPDDSNKPQITSAVTFYKRYEFLSEFLIKNVDGNVRKTSEDNFQWHININSDRLHFLKTLQENCIIKKEQIESCINWLEKYPTHKKDCVTAEETLAFVEHLQDLKKEDHNLVNAVSLDVDNYQLWTRTTATYPKELEMEYILISAAGEIGEICNKFKKVIRGDYPLEAIRETLIDELGDVFYYLARLTDALGGKLSEVMDVNQVKLDSRQERGVICGNGDNR